MNISTEKPQSNEPSDVDVAGARDGAADVAVGTERPPMHRRVVARLRRSRAIRRFGKKKAALVALAFIAFLVFVAVFHELLVPMDPNGQDLQQSLVGPSAEHLLGTDLLGRDTLSRLIAAIPVTLLAAVQALGISMLLGIPLGLAAGFFGRALDAVLSRIADGLMALPPLVLSLAVVAALGPGLTNAMIAVGIVLAPRFFRVARGAAQSIATEAFAEAARADGISSWRLLWRHVLPNASGPLVVQISFAVGIIIITEASLSYLGLGVQPPQATLGSMLQNAFANVRSGVFPLIPPAIVMSLMTMAFFLLGDGLRDSLGRDSS